MPYGKIDFIGRTHFRNNNNNNNRCTCTELYRPSPDTHSSAAKKAILSTADGCERASIKSIFLLNTRATPCVRPNKFRKTNSVLSDESVARTRKFSKSK